MFEVSLAPKISCLNVISEKSESTSDLQNPLLGRGFSSMLDRLIELSEVAKAWADGKLEDDLSFDEYSTLEEIEKQMAEESQKSEEQKEIDPKEDTTSHITDENVKQVLKDDLAYKEAFEEYQNTQKKINDLQEQIDALKYLNPTWRLTDGKEVDDLKDQRDSLKSQLPEMEENLKAAESQILSDLEKFPDMQNMIKDYADLREAKNAVKDIDDKLSELTEEFNEIDKSFSFTKKETKSEIEKAMTDAHEEKKALEKKIDTLEYRIQKNKSDNVQGYKSYEKVNQYLEILDQEKYLTNKLASKEVELEEIGKGYDSNGEVYTRLEEQIAKIKQDIQTAKNEAKSLRKELEDMGILKAITS